MMARVVLRFKQPGEEILYTINYNDLPMKERYGDFIPELVTQQNAPTGGQP
jgi:hypothetical protein